MKKTLALKAAVIGGGNIGALNDASVTGAFPSTHAGAFSRHPNFNLIGICDPILHPKLKNWQCSLFHEIDLLLSKEKPDVVSIAVPANVQFTVLMRLKSEPSIKGIISEKPFSNNLSEAETVLKSYAEANKKLFVNFPRRYSQMFADLAAKFRHKNEKVLSATIRYSKGLKNNGSHALDLAFLLFGKVMDVKVLASKIDYDPSDPSFSVFFKFQHCPEFYLQALDADCFTLFEVDIITETNRYLFTNDHREEWKFNVEDNTGIPSGKRLVFQEICETDYERCFVNLMNDVFETVTTNKEPTCSAQEAVNVHRLIDKIIND